MIVVNSACSVCASCGNGCVGCESASRNHTAWTCAALSPAAARCAGTQLVQYAADALARIAAVCPPCAQFASTTRGFFAVSVAADCMNALKWITQLDMPMEMNPILPFTTSTLPAASRGTTCAACASPAISCASGRTFDPPG